MLVSGGHAVSSRPDSIDPWQWDCGGGCWRPALVRSGNSAWMILIGGKGGAGLTMPKFASVLADMGATDAMGFDNNNSAELWRPGHRPDHRLRLRAAPADGHLTVLPGLAPAVPGDDRRAQARRQAALEGAEGRGGRPPLARVAVERRDGDDLDRTEARPAELARERRRACWRGSGPGRRHGPRRPGRAP